MFIKILNKDCRPVQLVQMSKGKEIFILSNSAILSQSAVLISYLSILFLDIFTLLTYTQSVNNLSHSFIVVFLYPLHSFY